MNDGSAFPARDLAIFLAMGVIITSLVAASIGLPLLLRNLQMPDEPSPQAEEDAAWIAAAHAAIGEIERVRHDLAERSEEHTSELQSLMRISYAVFCLKKNTRINTRELSY